MPFAMDTKSTYEDSSVGRHDKVRVAQPGSGLEKRQCTLQLCFSPEDNNIKPDIIFRGGGKRLKPQERLAWDKGVDVYFQSNAWADTKFCCDWVNKTLKSGCESAKDGDKEFVLLCDNLVGQVSDEFKQAVRKINGIVHYGPPGATDIWQPVDAGYGKMLKTLVTHEQNDWLQLDENYDLWIGNTKGLNASMRRILITQWVGKAHRRLQDPKYDHFRRNCFERTGCLMTADGSEDHKINPEGLPGYKPMAPMPTSGPDEGINETPDPAPEPEDLEPDNDDDMPRQELDITETEMEEGQTDASCTERIDSVKDRNYSDFLVGKNIRGLYIGGWQHGTIDYFNNRLQQYHIKFADSAEDDYIGIGDIDGIEMILEP